MIRHQLKLMHLTELGNVTQKVDIAPDSIERIYEVLDENGESNPVADLGTWIRFNSGCTIRVAESRAEVHKSYHVASSFDFGGTEL